MYTDREIALLILALKVMEIEAKMLSAKEIWSDEDRAHVLNLDLRMQKANVIINEIIRERTSGG